MRNRPNFSNAIASAANEDDARRRQISTVGNLIRAESSHIFMHPGALTVYQGRDFKVRSRVTVGLLSRN